MKKETPILYSTPMVKSIVKNIKTKTRPNFLGIEDKK